MDPGLEARFVLAQAPIERVDWEPVYRELLPRVFRYFCYLVGEEPLAEDLTGETFKRAWRGRDRFRHELGAFSSWVFGIARRVASEHFRHTKRASQYEVEVDVAEFDRGRTGRVSIDRSVEEAVRRNADFARLGVLLAEMPERERELVAMKYGAELTNRAIAGMTGLSETNVGTILHRTVGRLRTRWEVNDG